MPLVGGEAVLGIRLSAGSWDAHTNLKKNHTKNCQAVDQPIATLLKDLKQRGMLQDTLVVWATEFGRTAGNEEQSGRDHHPFGFTMLMAGGGVKAGHSYGETDEIGFSPVSGAVDIHDLHATMLHLLGIDHERLTFRYKGRDFRLTDVAGDVIDALIA